MNSHLKELEERIAYEFKNKNLFTQALTHSSYANEHRLDHSRCNERLEFLGGCCPGNRDQRIPLPQV